MPLLKSILPFLFLFGGVAHAEPITEAQLRGHIDILASEEFQGRNPGTIGENKTVNYIAVQWSEAGLKPAARDGTWYEPVTLVERKPLNQMIAMTRTLDGRTKAIRIKDDQLVIRGDKRSTALTDASMIFAGYGQQEDVTLAIVQDKIAILLFSAPTNEEDFPDYGKRKQALIDAGAAAVLTIVKGKRRWKNSARRFLEGSTGLSGDNAHAAVEGLISQKQLEKIIRKAGLNFDDLTAEAADSEFKPEVLPVIADISVDTEVREYQSHNVIGKIAGTNPEAGALLYLGHWDHFGQCLPEEASEPQKDRICNGAVDNASGISLLIETAKRLATQPIDRDIYFLATTAEEKGLLGAKAFVENPSFDIKRLVIALNADTVALAPAGNVVAVVGRGETDLDPELEKVAAAENREIDKSNKANAFLKRQDGYVFLEKGIPAFMITSAFSDQERLDTYLKGRYHDVSDEADDGLVLGGAVDDANFHVALGRYFGNVSTYPSKAP